MAVFTASTVIRYGVIWIGVGGVSVRAQGGNFVKRRSLESFQPPQPTTAAEQTNDSRSNESRSLWKSNFLNWVKTMRSAEGNEEPLIDETTPTSSHCGCATCDESIWSGSDAAGHSCGARITFLADSHPTIYSTETTACARVAGIEYPDVCGACNPATCGNEATQTAPLFQTTAPRLSFCGCPDTCTSDVYWSIGDDAAGGVSCAAHITWAQTHLQLESEVAACLHVAQQLPNSLCGQWCNPTTCNGNAAPPVDSVPAMTCGCPSTCTAAALETSVDATSTCGSRIEWLRDTFNMGETEACTQIASVEFPTLCGPMCDPTLCTDSANKDIGSSTTLTPTPNPTLDPTPSDFVIGTSPQPTTPAPVIITPQVSTPVSRDGLGPNVILFDPSMSTASIQGAFDDIFNRQVNNEMGSDRYSLYFMPGTYGTAEEPLSLFIGYYMDVAGLGASPLDVTIVGKIEVYNRCFEEDPYAAGKFIPSVGGTGALCFALNNFWRSLSNLSITIVHKASVDACRRTAMFWAISQASSMRRVEIRGGDLSLMDYCTNPGFSSGGFIADSKHVDGKIINGSQQQFCARNLMIAQWDGGVWNNVFLGVSGAPDDSSFPDPPFTTFATTPVSREKPYVFTRDGEYLVRVPNAKTESSGISWASEETDGITLPLTDFFVAMPTDSVATINSALSDGKHLLLTPGVYSVDSSIIVGRSNTVVLGLGHATLLAVNGAISLRTLNQPGIIISGVTFDAGEVESPVLLQIGDPLSSSNDDPSNPVTLHDIYFRVGGPYVGKAAISLEINSNHVLVDHTWVWRADHGIEPFDLSQGFEGDNIRWKEVIGRNGLVVNGNDVIATGLFVEHYQEYNVVWNGERGRVFFFQNELPYDPPTQSDWTASDGKFGWAGYKVSDLVTQHELHGGGVYSYNRNNPDIVTENGFEVPMNMAGVKMQHIYTRNLSGPGAVNAVINGVGNSVDVQNEGPEYVLSYP